MNAPRCILIVDDRESDRTLARRVLRKAWPDTTVLEACDGEEAIELLHSRDDIDLDIILLDINMPKMGGHEFLEAWYADSGIDVPVVFMLTSSDLPTDRERTERFASVRNYIVKPLSTTTAAKLPELAA